MCRYKIRHSKLTECLSVSTLNMPLITLVTVNKQCMYGDLFRYAANKISHRKLTVCLPMSNLDMPLITLITVK